MESKVIGKQVRNLVDDYFDYKDKCFEGISREAVKRGYLEKEFYNEISMFGLSREDMDVLIKKFRKFKLSKEC